MVYELEHTVLFRDLSHQELEEIARFCVLHQFHEGDILIAENGKDRQDLFILLSGSVEIVSSSAAMTSAEAVLSKEEKELFGEISWLTKHKRTATVRARGAVEVIRIDGEKLDAYMEQHPRVGFRVMRRIAILLSERLSETDTLLKQILWNTGV